MFKFIVTNKAGEEIYVHSEPSLEELVNWGRNCKTELPNDIGDYKILDKNNKVIALGKDYWTDKWYSSEKKAKLGVLAAGYLPKYTEVYQEDNHWRFRLTAEGLAGQAVSTAEAIPRKKLPEPPPRKRLPIERKRLNDTLSSNT